MSFSCKIIDNILDKKNADAERKSFRFPPGVHELGDSIIISKVQ